MGLRPYARERRGRLHRRQWLPKHRCNSSLGAGPFAASLDRKPSGVLAGPAPFGCPHSNCWLWPDLRPGIIGGPNPLTAASTLCSPVFGTFSKYRPRPAMAADRIEADIAVMNGRAGGSRTGHSGSDIRFTLETPYPALDCVEFSGSTSNAASLRKGQGNDQRHITGCVDRYICRGSGLRAGTL